MSNFDLEGKRVWVAGHSGMAGSAIARRLTRENCEIVTVSRRDLDLLRQPDVHAWMADERIVPTGTAFGFCLTGIKLCQAYRRQYGCDFISVMPTNLYGPGGRFDAQSGHVVAALIMKIHAAKVSNGPSVELCGSGKPKRELLFSEDLADACVFVMKNYSGEMFLNVGTGREMTILELAQSIAGVIGRNGTFTFDRSKPDGMPRKVMDVSRLRALGWSAPTGCEAGMQEAYRRYVAEMVECAA